MIFDEELLNQIEELAGYFLAPDEIAVLLNIEIKGFTEDIRNKSGEHYKRYFLGKTKAKLEIHKNIVRLAKKGSTQAEDAAAKMLSEQSIKERNG